MKHFGTHSSGQEVHELTLSHGALSARFLTLGAVLRDLRHQDIDHSLTLGSDEVAAYEGPMLYYGAVVGPVANRIRGARIPVGSGEAQLVANEGANTLHGGNLGLHQRVWEVAALGEDHVTFALSLPDGEEGWPGNRRYRATYRLLPAAVLEVVLEGETDKLTHCSLAHHGYWRMGPGPDLTGHRLTIAADRYTEVDDQRLPTGACPDVTGTDFDFRLGRPIGPESGAAYDHNFCLAGSRREPTFAARLSGPSGTLTITTSEPGLQLYDGARTDTTPFVGTEGVPYGKYCGVAMEPQLWPDAPHNPGFPSTLLHPGEVWRQETRFHFAP